MGAAARRRGRRSSSVAGGLALALPGIQEIPKDFPATLLWGFRLSSLGTQAVLWAALGVGFGIARCAPPAAGGARADETIGWPAR